MMAKAIKRLGVLEYLLLALAGVAALLAGALTGWLAREALGWSFRWTWTVSSLLYFVVPGVVALWQSRRDDAPRRTRKSEESNGG